MEGWIKKEERKEREEKKLNIVSILYIFFFPKPAATEHSLPLKKKEKKKEI